MKASPIKTLVPKGTTITVTVPREDGTKFEAVYEVGGFDGHVVSDPVIEEGQVHNEGWAWYAEPDRVLGFNVGMSFFATKMTLKEA